jgi:hypothetical protein
MLKGECKACPGPRSGISDELIKKLMAWHHSGFSVHAGDQIARDDRDGQKALAQYILQNAFSEQKITYIEDSDKILYRSGMCHGSNKKKPVLSLPKELVFKQKQRRKNQACPELVEGAWLFRPGDEPTPSPVSPEVTVLDVTDYKPPWIPSKTWRELIKKIWEADPLCCPRCAHEMKIISLIDEPSLIERILRHLGLWRQRPDLHDGKIRVAFGGPVVLEDYDDGWPRYEAPVITYH